MAHLCVICLEFLTGESSQSSSSKSDPAPKALNCGHVFHQHCIRDWFDGTGGRNQTPGYGSCPKCCRVSSLNNALRIFPEVETTAVVDAYLKVKAENVKLMGELKQTKDKLKEETTRKEGLAGQLNCKTRQFDEVVAEQDALVQKLSQATQKLEEVTMDHELLQVEHAEALSTVDSLTNDLQEKKDIIQAMEESAKAVPRTRDDRGQSQEPPPKRKKTGFRFTVLDKIQKCFAPKQTKANPLVDTIADAFIKSDKYKVSAHDYKKMFIYKVAGWLLKSRFILFLILLEMIYNCDTEPSRSTLESLVGDICKWIAVAIKDSSPSKEEDLFLLG